MNRERIEKTLAAARQQVDDAKKQFDAGEIMPPTWSESVVLLCDAVEELLVDAHEPYDFTHLIKRIEALETSVASAIRDRDTMHETLTIAQKRGSDLVEENRVLRAKLA